MGRSNTVSGLDTLTPEMLQSKAYEYAMSRKAFLLAEAQEARIETHTSKGLALGGFFITGFMLSNPLAAIAAIGLAGAYGYTVAREKMRTSELRPIPFCNHGIGDLMAMSGGAKLDAKDEFETDVLAFLDPREREEYKLLDDHLVPFINVLMVYPEELVQSFYDLMVDRYIKYGIKAFTGNPSEPRNVTHESSVGSRGSLEGQVAKAESNLKRIERVIESLPSKVEQVKTSPEVSNPTTIQTPHTVIQPSDAYAFNPISDEEAEEFSFEVESEVDTFSEESEDEVVFHDEFLPTVSAEKFEWSRLQDNDRHPVVAYIGSQGSGKSRLIKYHNRHVVFPGDVSVDNVVMDVFGDPAEWQGFEIVSEYADMVRKMSKDLQIINRRKQEYQRGIRNFKPMVRVLEEARDTIPTLKSMGSSATGTLQAWQRAFGSVTRKLKGRVCYASTALTTDALGGISAGERDAMTVIFPGKSGVAFAMKDTRLLKLGSSPNAFIREQLQQALMTVKRPCLVYYNGDWFWAEIPELDAAGNPFGHPDYYDPEAHPEIPMPASWKGVVEEPEDEPITPVTQPKVISEVVSQVVEKVPQPTVISQKKQPEISPEAYAVYLWARNEANSMYVKPRDAQQKRIKGAAKEVDGTLVYPKAEELKALFTELVSARMAKWSNEEQYEMEVI